MENVKNTIKTIGKNYFDMIMMALIAIPVGALIGAICTLFGRVLLLIGDFRSMYPLFLIPFLALGGLIIVFCYQKFGKNSGKGMGLVMSVGHGEESSIPLRLVPIVMGSTWLTHLVGGSAGREGVAVQIGATVSHQVGKRLPFQNASRIFLIAGMAAGFSGLFQTPVAAILFAMEVLAFGIVEFRALLPAFTASVVSCTVSNFLGLEKFTVALQVDTTIDLWLFLKLLVLGCAFGLAGALFTFLLKHSKRILGAKLKNPYLRILIMGVCLSAVLLFLYQGRYSGLGTNLIQNSFYGGTIYPYDWILKIVLTTLTLAAGFQGGEVTPLFSIGASLGVVLASLLGVPVPLAAALGYAAVFGSATNTFFAPILIGGEVFGFAYTPHFFVVCLIAYLVNHNTSIYGGQKNGLVSIVTDKTASILKKGKK